MLSGFVQVGVTTFSTRALEISCWSLWNSTFGSNIRSRRLWSPTVSSVEFWCNSFRELYWINPRDADTFESRSDTSPVETTACPKNLKQGAKREGRMQSSDICITELWGPLSCLHIKGPLDSSHQTPSSRTPPLISNFTHPPRKGHYADSGLHDLFLGLAAMEGSGSTWKCGISREFGECGSGDAHDAAVESGDDAGYKTEFWALKNQLNRKPKWTPSLLPPQTKICREDEEVNGRRKPRAADPREKMNEAAENTRSRGGKLNLLGKIQKAGTNKELLCRALMLQKLDSLRDVYCVSKTVDKDGWKILLNTMEEMIYFHHSESWRIGLSWSYHRKPNHVNRFTWADHALLQASSLHNPAVKVWFGLNAQMKWLAHSGVPGHLHSVSCKTVLS